MKLDYCPTCKNPIKVIADGVDPRWSRKKVYPYEDSLTYRSFFYCPNCDVAFAIKVNQTISKYKV